MVILLLVPEGVPAGDRCDGWVQPGRGQGYGMESGSVSGGYGMESGLVSGGGSLGAQGGQLR
jgi:hypothetical protein